MESITIEGKKREDLGQKAAKGLRREGQVPCVLYGEGDPVHFSAPELAFRGLIYTPDFFTADIKVGGESYTAVLKEIQFHPVTDRLVHLDFVKLIPGKTIIVDLPLRFEGLSAGVREGGKLLPAMRKLRVKGKPEDLVSEVKVDVTNLELGKTIKVGEVSLPNLEVMNNPGIPMVAVEIPRALKSAQGEEDAEDAAPAEGGEGEEAAAE